ncbi:glycosyl transferase [Azorhizobium caulinodans]|uniref:Putative glycosyltransferase n=1 Tax=Azorhizobium caulinodans (strain ATCC 43989 / DSM 5975 / JCM 20966 / LMG 6465 / NBRC 14845 / NCIMB 13405 / ORS 571) TaxID=438753 RepID=A8IBS3_AZOC5|nr:glycosyl transferase [Azorhizobium caulinodans]BAF89110.1 putative glycosyltransferase [Azorhizobium caulinodans ORS 571]
MNPANPTRVARYLASAAVKVFTGFDATADLRKALGLMVAPETVEEMPEDKALEGMGRRVVRALAPADQRPVCLFVTYSPDGRIWPHVISYCKDLKAGGCRLVMIVTTDRTDLKCYDPGLAVADSLIVLENFGYDFSAWARVLRLWPELWAAPALWFANDSVYNSPSVLASMLERVKRSVADVVALTESTAFRRHFQSYFFVLRPNALASEPVRAFFGEMRAIFDKQKVIETCEVPFPSILSSAGLMVDVLYPLGLTDARAANPTLMAWNELLKNGFPFVKVQLLRENPMHVDLSKWRADLKACGFRMDEVEMHVGSHRIPAAALLQAPVQKPSEKTPAAAS